MMEHANAMELLDRLYEAAAADVDARSIGDESIVERISFISLCRNRAGVRLLLSCLLGQLTIPGADPRKPYTKIGTEDSFSGRTLDEGLIAPFLTKYDLPCNATTAYLTPSLRNIDRPLTPDFHIRGTPEELYRQALLLLDDLAAGRVAPDQVFIQTVRDLIRIRDERRGRLASLLESLHRGDAGTALSSEQIVTLMMQHLACKNSSRLPVLMVAAVYNIIGEHLREQALPLGGHNAADLQTGALGDVEIRLASDQAVVTAYEMKNKLVTKGDIDIALNKLARSGLGINNYIFITTADIDPKAVEYAQSFYDQTGVEIAVLDCIGFIRHFLHLFHRVRMQYLDRYQELVLAEPDSAVNPALKEAFLALRQAAESGE